MNTTAVVNNGIFLADRNIKAGSHLDSYHLMNMIGEQKPMDLGPIDIWAMTQKVEMPLYQFSSFNGKNTVMVENANGEFKWQIPIVADLPYIMENVELTETQLGLDGTTFKVKFNKRAFGHSDIITYDKMHGKQYRITDDDIFPTLDGFIFTLAPINTNTDGYLDLQFLEPGQVWERVGSAKSSEYGEKYSDLGEVSNGYREFYNFVGDADANVHYTVSSKAALMLKGGINADGSVPITEMWRSFDHGLDPSITSIDSMVKTMGKDYINKAQKSGKLTRTFLTKMEAAHLTKIGQDIERYLMWGQGGIVRQDGPDDIRLSVGLWKQLDNSFKTIYNLSTFNLDMFRGELFNHFNGKEDFKTVDPTKTVIVQTGMGGMKLINAAIMAEANSNGMSGGTINLDKSGINAISGTAMDLNYGFTFTSFTIPFLANVKFVLNPSFDNVNTNNTENPLIDGFNLSSYNFIIFDITGNDNDNIFLLKKKYDHEFKWHYQNGTMDYMGRTQGFASSGSFSGYRVMMSQAMPSIWVKDPTRILKMVLRNPITGE